MPFVSSVHTSNSLENYLQYSLPPVAIRQKIKKYIFTETFLLHLEKNSGVRYMQGKFFNWMDKNDKD